ncbi:MAG: fibrobacter succinogenes major paralogous domain-containing protein [Paludibacter sp.]|jgi:uncharacterized protein (TIGR02145 family)|nr:fibrobacter succinogenes major paralogous domain-containing protein [Paludibacter sp.]
MNTFKKINLIALAIFTVSTIFAQEIKTVALMKNGSVVYEKPLTNKDSIFFKTYTPSTEINGVEINGVVWATRNVDMPGTFTENITDYGMLYQWNRPIGWSYSNPMVNSEGGTIWDSSMPTGDTWEESNNVCPTGWRVPTQAEITSLNNSGSVWTTVNGVNGRIYGSGETVVFFPAVGFRNYDDGSLDFQGSSGSYWSATVSDVSSTYSLNFGSSSSDINYINRDSGFSVRCVAE